MLSQDYNGTYKLTAEGFKKSLMPYIKNNGVFKRPGDGGRAASYSFNGNLAGIRLAKIQAPAAGRCVFDSG